MIGKGTGMSAVAATKYGPMAIQANFRWSAQRPMTIAQILAELVISQIGRMGARGSQANQLVIHEQMIYGKYYLWQSDDLVMVVRAFYVAFNRK